MLRNLLSLGPRPEASATPSWWGLRLLLPSLLPVLLLSTGCRGPHAGGAKPVAGGSAPPLQLDLPPSFESERSRYEHDVRSGLEEVAAFFRTSGFDLVDRGLIDSVLVFASVSEAREFMATSFGAPLESIPDTFSGTVSGRRLFLVSRAAYREIWRKLYSDWPWTDATYHQLIAHELAHRAHESIAISQFGTADAMGPTWFFEGLAVVCAGQFDAGQPLLSREEVRKLVGSGHAPAVSYPLYGRIVRSLAAEFRMKTLIATAAGPEFPFGE